MKLEELPPGLLLPNPWNTNHLTPEAELKLENSLRRRGMFKPVVVRQLADGEYEILGGQHRAMIAARMGMTTVPIFNLGAVDDQAAQEIGVLDNSRYGQDDATALSRLLNELGSPAELATFMAFDTSELDAIHKLSTIDLDRLGLEDEDAPAPETKPVKEARTHTIMRFKVPIADQHKVEDRIKSVIAAQGYADSDSMVNAGDALVWLALHATAEEAI
jgi:ParB-like chromosome segregation protein Spo0J